VYGCFSALSRENVLYSDENLGALDPTGSWNEIIRNYVFPPE